MVTAALLALSAPAEAPEFDCTAAVAADDVLICRDETLTRLDAHLGRLYVMLRRALTQAASEELKRDQRAWVFRRNAGCGLGVGTDLEAADLALLTSCFRSAYAERLAFLGLMLDMAPPRGADAAPTPSKKAL